MNEGPLVFIEWEDSRQPGPSWEFLSSLQEPTVVRCASVGWLIGDVNGVKALAPNMGDVHSSSMQASGIIQIPARCVVRMITLNEPDLLISASDPALSSRPEPGQSRQAT